MLSENEQRRLAEIESSLSGDDPGFAHRFESRMAAGRRRRRWIAAVVAACGVIAAIVGLTQANVPVVVIAMCSIGVAAGIYTWKRPHQQG